MNSDVTMIRNIVQNNFLIPNFNVDTLYILSVKCDRFGKYVEEKVEPDQIKFLDVVDVSKNGFSLVIEMESLERYLIVFNNPFDLNKVIKLINKAKDNKQEIARSKLDELKFNIDYFENLLKTEVHKDFTIKVLAPLPPCLF